MRQIRFSGRIAFNTPDNRAVPWASSLVTFRHIQRATTPPPQNFTCDIAESSISKSPIPPPELYALAIDRLHERQLFEASSMNSCIAVPPASRRRNTGSTTRTRFQHPTAHPFLKTAYHLQRLSLHPLSHTETNAFNEIPISQNPISISKPNDASQSRQISIERSPKYKVLVR